jgi:hypothetical protein
MRNSLLVVFALLTGFSISCRAQVPKQAATAETNAIFPKGELGPAQNFTGKAWAYSLVANDSTYNTLVGQRLLSSRVPEATGTFIRPDKCCSLPMAWATTR